jgi:hypothetical protein
LSEKGKARIPKIVECIQCGNIIDDGENGLLARFFSQSNIKLPLVWIRGHQPNYDKWENTRNKSLVRYLANKHHIEGKNVIIWESIRYSHYSLEVFSTASDIVQRLSDYLEKNGFSPCCKIHLIPYTTEDQAKVFVQSLSKLKNPTVSYLYRPFDLVDVRLSLEPN